MKTTQFTSLVCVTLSAAMVALCACSARTQEPQAAPVDSETPAVETNGLKKAVPRNYYGRIGQRMASMLPRYHVRQWSMNDEISRRAWTNLVSFYDFDHSVFLQEDLDLLAQHETTIDDELNAGKIDFGFEVYELYCQRLRERIDFVTNLLLTTTFDFTTNEVYRIRRKDAPWPQTREEAEEHWRRRMKNELLAQELTRELEDEEKAEKEAAKAANAVAQEKTDEAATSDNNDEEVDLETAEERARTPVENLIKRYRQYVTVLTEPDEEAVLQQYLSAVARAYDPHSDYMSPTTKEDFDMDMNLSMCGIGAVLSMDDGALKIVEIVSGGPVDRDGRIKEGDKIVGVAQGEGEMEDIMWQPMKKTIRKIRGAKGTRVSLELVPRSDPTGTVRKRVDLVRDEIKFEDQAATGRVETVTCGGFTNKLGYIYLPGFYGTMDKHPGDEGYRSAAEDVAQYVGEFNSQDARGLILDLRGNGGGSLREAVLLSSLFVPNGPVVQVADTRTVNPLAIPRGNPVAFRKPIVVMIDRASASASEIVAGHLRDTGRAIVLGDVRTHGKGTVQTLMGMGPEKFGSMKITTARFYRVNGWSTQVKGVEADIHLPSLLDSLDIGEDKLTYALEATRLGKAPYTPCWNLDQYIPSLRARSEARLESNERYKRHLASVAGMKEISDREFVTLERTARKALMKSDRALRELDSEGDEEDEMKTRRRRNKQRRTEDDVVLAEAFQILSDLVELTQGADLPPSRNDWYEAILGL